MTKTLIYSITAVTITIIVGAIYLICHNHFDLGVILGIVGIASFGTLLPGGDDHEYFPEDEEDE